ncbi:hypothetical protein E1B28_012752 [Marasmius oreades]|uniref:Uncharacterized protein n=1 Tax=Marasmius oreades TaxID=181124 RepID=A0A9P7UP10_9AGAR|nr:uncharacterized protein E1B28_012752 [Marasmius oreades]KAG7088788.1 hypothetical protein E1B28_012752 [Marasmius oreades]
MALTQTARIPGPGPSWDEEVVPALRQRLESESRTLSRRLSATPIPSGDEYQYRNDTINSYNGDSSYNTNQSYQNGAIYTARLPQQPRNNSDHNAPSRVNSGNSSAPRRPSRSRTQSQPFKSDHPNNRMNSSKINGATTSGDTSSSSRPISPSTSIKPSRIPQPSRTRTASLSSNHYAPFPNATGSTNAHTSPYSSPPLPDRRQASASDLWKVQETSSHSTVSVISKQRSGILNEEPPFKQRSRDDPNPSNESLYDDRPRMSAESQERPFEHWYRGDISRNGGVGELRVGKRQEMMDIANYGYSLKPKPDKPVVRNAITDAIERKRRRADSVGNLTDRTSFYMDEEQAKNAGRVLDENPPTDVEGEMSNGEDFDIDYYLEDDEQYQNMDGDQDTSTASAPLPSSSDLRSTTPTPHYSRPSSRNQNSNSRIPAPRAITPTPSQSQRGASEPPSIQHSSTAQISTPPASRSKQHTQQLRSTSTSPSGTRPGNRGVSPNTLDPSGAKKTRMNANKATQAKLAAARKKEMEEEMKRKHASASYPDPGDEEDMAHAIPTWTQSVPNRGNWDEVVLPTVARKKGLAGHYEEADGSPKVKQEDGIPSPAPGTFGYDRSKYRPPRSDGGDESIPMDEFGRPQEEPDLKETLPPVAEDQFNTSISELQNQHRQQMQQQQQPRHPHAFEHPSSPVPFSQYTHGTAEPDTKEAQREQVQHLEKEEAGCCSCKCVVM